MLSQLEEYKNRVSYKGKNKREYVKTKVKESINDLIDNSQYGFTISVDDVNYDVAILSTKTTQEYEAANIIAHLETGIDKGTVFKWDGSEWIVLKKMFRPDQPGFNGIAYRCTGYLKWIDDEDNTLHVQPAYIRSGRITNALGVTPDKNQKYDNILMHDTDWNMMAATQQNLDFHPEMRFIIKGEAYRVTNVDNVSVDNVSVISLVDDKLLDTDDRINGIAYKDDYIYTVESKLKDNVKLYAGDIMELPIIVKRQGKIVDDDVIMTSFDSKIIEIEGNRMIGRGIGNTVVRCALARNNTIYVDIPVEVSSVHTEQEIKLFIEGNDYIDWNGTETYYLSNRQDCNFEVEVKSKIRKEINFTNNSVTISIKDKYSGTIVITCETPQGEISKTVYIRTV